MIDEKKFEKNVFNFKHTDHRTVSKIIDKPNPKKATGADKISAKLLKNVKDIVAEPVTNLINLKITVRVGRKILRN